MTVLAAPSASVVGEIIDESIAFGARKSSFVIISKRPSDRDACGLRIFMIQNQGPHSARVPSPFVTTNMRLARDQRAQSECDRLQPHAYGRGGLACGECAVMAHVCRPPVRTVGRDGGGV